MANKNNKNKNNSNNNTKNKNQNQSQNRNQNQSGSAKNNNAAQVKQDKPQEQVKSTPVPATEVKNTTAADGGFSVDTLLELAGRYKRYLAAGVLFIVMVVLLIKCTNPVKEKTSQNEDKPAVEQQTAQDTLTEEFEIDTIPEVNQLISNYYAAYAAGDTDKLGEYAAPISETEKSYINVFSQYVEGYENISCYTKTGLASGEYIVSVYLEMKFKDIDTLAPGLDCFYLRTNENGSLYIDNAYSQFNQSNMEESTQADVQALLNGFEKEEDVMLLQANVQQKYEQAIASDEALNVMANETLPNTISAWIQSLSAAEEQKPEEGSENAAEENKEENKDDEKTEETGDTQDEQSEDTQENTETEDTKPEKAESEAKAAYATDTINLRKEASTSSSVLIQIPLGDKLKYYPDSEKDGWVKASYSKKSGYVKLEYITTKKSNVPSQPAAEEPKPAKALPEGKEYTLTDTVNLRAAMSETAEKVGVVPIGDVVKVVMSYAEGWTKVEWNDKTGYIKTDLIK